MKEYIDFAHNLPFMSNISYILEGDEA